jgi:hypothetical protein
MNFQTTIWVNASPESAFNRIHEISAWWTENAEGSSRHKEDEFIVRFGDVHFSRQKLDELVPSKKITWLVTESRLNFIKEREEWTGTRIHFDLSERNGGTEIRFTHEGLDPEKECYEACAAAWTGYIRESLFNYLSTGKGMPAPAEVA